MKSPIRLAAVMTHPIQYYSPWFRYIAREVKDIRLQVLYVSEPSSGQQGTGFGESFEWDVPLREGYESVVLRPSRPSDRFESDRFFGLDAPGIGAAISSYEPDAVLLSGWHSLSMARAILACRRRGIPLLYRGDTHLQGREGDRLWRYRSVRLLSLFDRFLAVGQRVREYLDRLGVPREHVFASPHAVDNDFFASRAEPLLDPERRAEARKEWGIEGDEFLPLFVGKLDANKRPDLLLRAVGSMNGRARVVVVGTGPHREECRELAAHLGVKTDFRGFLNQTEMPRAYALSDCLVLPSTRESWGLTVNEAMSCGLPAVVSDGVGCAPDLIEPGSTGEVFPAGESEALADRLKKIEVEIHRGIRRSVGCRRKIAGHTFAAATEGLLSACRSLAS
jgi:glycosyltransferase involved in cell wall biosynthesis